MSDNFCLTMKLDFVRHGVQHVGQCAGSLAGHSSIQDASQRLFLMLLHILVQILVLILSHMLIHTLDEASSEHSIASLALSHISFLTFNGPLIEIIASHSWKAVTSAAMTHFDGRILVAESGARIQVPGIRWSNIPESGRRIQVPESGG